MKLVDILDEETTRLNDYYVPQYFKSRAPYSKREIGNNIYNIHDKDGILVATFNENNIGPFRKRSWREEGVLNWGIDWNSPTSKPPILLATNFTDPLLEIAGVKNPVSKRSFNWLIYSNSLKYFNINRNVKTPEGESTVLREPDIGVTKSLIGGEGQPATKKDKGQVMANKTVIGRKKQIIREKIQKNNMEIKIKLAEIKKLTKEIEVYNKQISQL